MNMTLSTKYKELTDKLLSSELTLEEFFDDVIDIFADNACDWLIQFCNNHFIMDYTDCCEIPTGQIIESFKEDCCFLN